MRSFGHFEAEPVGVGPGGLRGTELASHDTGSVDARRDRREFRCGLGAVEGVDASRRFVRSVVECVRVVRGCVAAGSAIAGGGLDEGV